MWERGEREEEEEKEEVVVDSCWERGARLGWDRSMCPQFSMCQQFSRPKMFFNVALRRCMAVVHFRF